MEETRHSILAFERALLGVKKFSDDQRAKWLAYAGSMPDEFVTFLTDVAAANPADMLLLEKSLEQKKLALSADDVGAWRRIIKWEGDLLETMA